MLCSPLRPLAAAAPFNVAPRDDPLAPLVGGTPISEDVFKNIVMYSQFTAATYCTSNNNQNNAKISCTDDACPDVTASNVTSVVEFQQ